MLKFNHCKKAVDLFMGVIENHRVRPYPEPVEEKEFSGFFNLKASTPGSYTWELIVDRDIEELYVGDGEVPESLKEEFPDARGIVSVVWEALIGHRVGDNVFLDIAAEDLRLA